MLRLLLNRAKQALNGDPVVEGKVRAAGSGVSHLRDIGWVAKTYQVAEERGSITEHQIQSHQSDDTWRQKRSGLGGRADILKGQPPPTPTLRG